MTLKQHGPGGCCCGCFTITDPFEDFDLEVAANELEVYWITLNAQNPFPPEYTNTDFGFMDLTPRDPQTIIFPVTDTYNVEGSSGDYYAVVNGRIQYQVTLETGASFQVPPRFLFGSDGSIHHERGGGNSSGSAGTRGRNFLTPILADDADSSEFRVRFEVCEWEHWDWSQVEFPDQRHWTGPMAVFTQPVTADPDEDDEWTRRLTIIHQRLRVDSDNGKGESIGTRLGAVNNKNATENESDWRPANTTVVVDNHPPRPGGSDGRVRISDWTWKADEQGYGFKDCPTLDPVIWPGFDFKEKQIVWTIAGAGLAALNATRTLPTKVYQYANPFYWELDVDIETTLAFGDTNYDVEIYRFTIQNSLGTLTWGVRMRTKDTGILPPPPFWTGLSFSAVVPTIDSSINQDVFPKTVTEDDTISVICDWFPTASEQAIYDAIFGPDWTMTFHST